MRWRLRPRPRSGGSPAPTGTWPCSAILLGFSVFSDLTAIETESRLKISGSFLALVLAMVLLGGTAGGGDRRDLDPRRLAALARSAWHDLLVNLLTYTTFPLIVGVAFHEMIAHSRDHHLGPGLLRARLRRLPRWRWRSTSR